MTIDIEAQLERVAAGAPVSLTRSDLWRAGVRRQRRRRTAAVGGVVAAVTLLVGLSSVPSLVDGPPAPAEVPFDELHIPRTVWAPDPDAPGTDEAGAPGALAVVAGAPRAHSDAPESYGSYFGVAASTGDVVWLDLPIDDLSGSVVGGWGALALSPDGRKVAYLRYGPASAEGNGQRALGWGVYDTTTGETLELTDPRTGPHSFDYAQELAFSGDSTWLLTSYAPSREGGRRAHAFVAWHAETGERKVLEEPGRYWLPGLGSGPAGVVWSRGRSVFVADPVTGSRSQVRLPDEATRVSYGPDGRASAYTGHAPGKAGPDTVWPLHVGTTLASAVRTPLADLDNVELAGWRDQHTVVVDTGGGRLTFVDVRTGDVVDRARVRVRGQHFPAPLIAADLLANRLVDGVEPPSVRGPLSPWWLAVPMLAGGALAGLWWWRRRARD